MDNELHDQLHAKQIERGEVSMPDDKPFGWTVYYVGLEGFRESAHADASTPEDLASRRDSVLKMLTEIGAVSDVRKLFDGNDSKPVGQGSKLDKFRQPKPSSDEPLTAENATTPMEKAAADSIAAPDAPVKIKPITPDEYGFRQADKLKAASSGMTFEKPSALPTTSKLAKFQPKPTAVPAPAPVVASAPNVSPKLSRFVAKEKKGE